MNEIQSNPTLLPVPTLEDWHSEPWSLDVLDAFEHFNGKTFQESVRLFEENALYFQEDIMFMPSRVFGYYLRAYLAYLLSETSANDSDGANCFIGLVEHKLECKPEDIRSLWSEVRPVLERLGAKQMFYGANPENDGSFLQRVDALLSAFPASDPTRGMR